MWRSLCSAYCFIQIVIFVQATGFYTIIGPDTLRSNFKYNVAVSVHEADTPCTIEIGITGSSFNETKSVEVQPKSTRNVEFDVPELQSGTYNLTARGTAGIIFQEFAKLIQADNAPLAYIQTDKGTYKPGDLVQFRVLFTDENTLPANIEKPVNIIITDGSKNRVKQFKDVEIINGVYQGEVQLSEQPVLGSWSIAVHLQDNVLTDKTFDVAKYVLPKFEVIVETAKNVAIPDGVIKVTVRAKYTYGKSVRGKATVSLKPQYNFYGVVHNNLEAQKTIDVDGKGHVEFSLEKDLMVSSERMYLPPLEVLAVVEEELTGNKHNSSATIHLHSERYRIEGIEKPFHFQSGKPTIYKVVIKNLDGSPVQDSKNTATLTVSLVASQFGFRMMIPDHKDNALQKPLTFHSKLDEHGMATFEFTLPDENNYFTVHCSYLDTVSYLSSISRWTPIPEEELPLTVTVLTKNPQLGKNIKVEVKSKDPLSYIVYTVTARGNILYAERIDFPDNPKSYVIEIKSSFQMIPQSNIFVHYIQDGNLSSEEKIIYFERQFANSIEISTTDMAKPGQDAELNIVTDPGSFVGLLGVDQSVLLLKSGNDLNKDEIFNGLDRFRSEKFLKFVTGPGEDSGMITLTNAKYSPKHEKSSPPRDYLNTNILYLNSEDSLVDNAKPESISYDEVDLVDRFDSDVESSPSHPDPVISIRKDFPDTWIWSGVQSFALARTDMKGFSLTKKVPDTITSWVITGFSLNPKTGLALTEKPSKIQVFQPFFVSTNLPYSVKRGEVIAIPVIVFNYMDKALDAEVTMDNSDKEYDFTEATNEVLENPLDEVQRTKRLTIPSNAGQSLSFMIRPKHVGTVTLKITALTPLAGDSIQQKLKVEPEGVTQYRNSAFFVNLIDEADAKGSIEVDVPSDAVPDSEYIEFSVVGDLLGPTIKNIHELVRMPYGCGEQNMVNFVPNILVLKYLETIHKENEAITGKAKKFLEVGYQRELTYKHDDGSFSAFGKSDPSGSTWLTAYVARSFHQAAKYVEIDSKVITEALNFLAAKQVGNGSFAEAGKLFDYAHQSELGLTAFVLLAFLENAESTGKYEEQIKNGVKYLEENIEKVDDQYSLSIAALALKQAKSPIAEMLLSKLQALARNENDRRWWSNEAEGFSSSDVEITSYILLSLLESESAENVSPAIKWLISQRNSNGGFSYSQNTVLGLQALIKFAEKAYSGSGEMDVPFTFSDSTSAVKNGSINVNKENALLVQSHVLPRSTRHVDFTAHGKGSSLVQLSYRFNLADKEKKPSFKVHTTLSDGSPKKQLVMDVCAEYVLLDEGGKNESNMAVVEVALPSGYTAEPDSFSKIEQVDNVKRIETKNSDSTVIVYFDSFTVGDVKCIPIEATKMHAVAKQKPSPIVVYDYYEPERKATEYYEVKSSLCDICEADDCGVGCKNKNTN